MPEEKKVSESLESTVGTAENSEPKDIFEMSGSRPETPIDGTVENGPDVSKPENSSRYERELGELRKSLASSVSVAPTKHDDVVFDADAIRNMEDASARVQKLLELAGAKGVMHAVSVAEHIDAYTLDSTHDRIADELSDELRKKGLLDDSGE